MILTAVFYWVVKNTAMNDGYDFYRRFHASGGVKAGVSMLGGVHLGPASLLLAVGGGS